MKYLLSVIVIFFCLSSCSQKYIKIEVDYGAMTSIITSGELGGKKEKSTYLIYDTGLGERPYKMKQGWVVFSFVQPVLEKEKSIAYRLLDSLDKFRAFKDVDLEKSNWDEEERKNILFTRSRYWDVKERFDRCVKLNIEEQSLQSGVSYTSFLTYEEIPKWKDTTTYARTWNLKDLGIFPSDGIADGLRFQKVLDSAFALDGVTKLILADGDYCFSDLNGRGINLHDGQKIRLFDDDNFKLGWCLGCCNEFKK